MIPLPVAEVHHIVEMQSLVNLVEMKRLVAETEFWQLCAKAEPTTNYAIIQTLQEMLVSNVSGISEEVQSAVSEYLENQEGQLGPEDVDNILGIVSEKVGSLPENVEEGVTRLVSGAYLLGRNEMAKQIKIEPFFDVNDVAAQEWLQNDAMFWVGSYYDREMGEKIAAVTKEIVLDEGLSRVEAGKKLKEALGDRFDKSDAYWEGLAGTAVTRARTFGTVGTLEEVGALTYRWINPDDERTCPVCDALDGTVFEVKNAVAQRKAMMAIQDPEEVREKFGWPSSKDRSRIAGMSPEELSKESWILPPIHFYCRCAINVEDFATGLDAFSGGMEADAGETLTGFSSPQISPPQYETGDAPQGELFLEEKLSDADLSVPIYELPSGPHENPETDQDYFENMLLLEQKLADNPFENGVGMQGNRVVVKAGGKHRGKIELTLEEKEALANGTFTHNHTPYDRPGMGGGTFSLEDVTTHIQHGLAETRAVEPLIYENGKMSNQAMHYSLKTVMEDPEKFNTALGRAQDFYRKNPHLFVSDRVTELYRDFDDDSYTLSPIEYRKAVDNFWATTVPAEMKKIGIDFQYSKFRTIVPDLVDQSSALKTGMIPKINGFEPGKELSQELKSYVRNQTASLKKPEPNNFDVIDAVGDIPIKQPGPMTIFEQPKLPKKLLKRGVK